MIPPLLVSFLLDMPRYILEMPRTGFDPIFYLHHAQVDRLLSLWSAINPDVWVSKATQRRRTFTTAAGAAVDEKSGLQRLL